MDESIRVTGAWSFVWLDQDGRELRRQEEINLVVATGLAALAAMVIGEIEQDCAVWLGMGTGTTAPVATNIALEAETCRKIVTTKSRSSGTIVYRFYLLTSEAVGDYTEWGVFWEGTASPGSGRLINRLVPTGGVSKDSNENLIIEVRLSLAAA